MSTGEILEVMKEAMSVSFAMAGPMLLVSIVVGLIVAIFQAATQIHEQTLTFVPKLIVIAVVLFLLGPWMFSVFNDFVQYIFSLMTKL
ncbi:MAG: flagellar biosynthesis protein FliQ [Candidatus Ruminococcus intestinipullorum]|nr:flagellar biosynthesis protein FliQ [Candidatus Ruminococcus intestinipullorum]